MGSEYLERESLNRISNSQASVEVRHISSDLPASSLDDREWDLATAVSLTHYWSGVEAPRARHAEARLLWSDAALHVRFSCRQHEPLVISRNPQTDRKTIGLWDRDVCEIFIAPNPNLRDNYFEFEAAPTGEWIDLAIKHTSEGRKTDFEFSSGVSAAGRMVEQGVLVAMRIPWQGAIKRPQLYENWRANLFRCVGSGEDRGYLAWRPTRTVKPDFHAPQAFGELHFI